MKGETEIETWFRQYRDDLYNYLVYFIGRTDVEDLVQETFIRALSGMQRFSRRSHPKTWLFSIARNIALDDMRKRRRARAHQSKMEVSRNAYSTPEDWLSLTESQTELVHAIRQLRPHYREVIILRGVMEYSVRETAELLGWKESRVRVTLFRALKSLRLQLSRESGGGAHEYAR